MGCNCGKPKCNGKCGCKSPAVIQINNHAEYITFHKVKIPASLGDSTTYPPRNGAYRNTLVYYEADNTSWLYSTDGIPTNITGATGPVGPKGPSGTMEVGTTTTGEPGTDASVENVGTPENAILNFTIPKGDKGDQGIQGEPGPQGYMNEQDVRDVVDTIIPADFFGDDSSDSDCGDIFALENMRGGDPINFSISGDTEQDTYSGKNLFDCDNPNNINGYINASNNLIVSASHTAKNVYIECEPNTTYTVSKYNGGTDQRFAVFTTDTVIGSTIPVIDLVGTKSGSDDSASYTITTSATAKYLFVFYAKSDVTTPDYTEIRKTIQIEVGAEATPFEKFVGGVPSPNPEYPQDVKTVTGTQTIKISNKNLFNINTHIYGGYFSANGTISGYQDPITTQRDRWFYIECKPNTTYTITKPQTPVLSNNRFRVGTSSSVPVGGTILDDFWNAGDGQEDTVYTITTGASAKYLCVFYAHTAEEDASDVVPSVLNGIQIELGSSSTSYVRSYSRTFDIDLGNTKLCKFSTYQDYIYKDDGVWKIHKDIGSALFDGSSDEDWKRQGPNSSLNGTGFYISVPDSESLSPAYSNRFIVNNVTVSNWDIDLYQFRITNSHNAIFKMAGKNVDPGTLSTWRTYLDTHNISLFYPLATPTDTIIDDVDLIEQLEQIDFESGENVITVSSDNLIGELCVEGFLNNWNGTIDSIDKDISDIKKEMSEFVDFIFPKFWSGAYHGDCNLIKYGGINILIDCYHNDQWTEVKDMLDDNGAQHLDVFVLTHYHIDHYGNWQNLIDNGYIDEDTIVYLPADVTTYGQTPIDLSNTIKSYCNSRSIRYRTPEEGEKVRIGEKLYFTFVNCDKDIIDAYTTKDLNSSSICIWMQYGDTEAFYAGDATTAVLSRLHAAGYPLRNVNLYKMAHHGVNQTTDEEFIRELSPEFAVQPSGLGSAIRNNYVISEDSAVLKMIGTRVYQCHMQPDYVVLRSDGSSVECLQGKVFGTSDQGIGLTYYVDANARTDVIQDGTQSRPFTTLMQAISAIPYKVSTDVTINVADGYYGAEHGSEAAKNRIYFNTGRNVRITINGNEEDRTAVVLNGIFSVSSFFTLNNITIDLDNQTGLIAYNSTIILNDVGVESYTGVMSESPHSALLIREDSLVIAGANATLRIDKCHECIITQSGSRFMANGTVSIGEHDSNIINSTNADTITQGYFIFDDPADRYALVGYQRIVKTPVQVMASHSEFAQSVTLLRSASRFAWIEILYKTSDGKYGSTGKIYSPNSKSVSAVVGHYAQDGTVYNKQCQFYISGTTISIQQSLQLHIVSGSAPTITSSSTYFDIVKVFGGYTDYIELGD